MAFCCIFSAGVFWISVTDETACKVIQGNIFLSLFVFIPLMSNSLVEYGNFFHIHCSCRGLNTVWHHSQWVQFVQFIWFFPCLCILKYECWIILIFLLNDNMSWIFHFLVNTFILFNFFLRDVMLVSVVFSVYCFTISLIRCFFFKYMCVYIFSHILFCSHDCFDSNSFFW